ncbi:cupin domain-containing protein [Candidatus Roizmanbacteria bacterium]|nr:cupin domain-containing protein [Candidatus Roizmanbacteria bacterium]
MNIIHKRETKHHKNSDACTAIEYPMNDKDINGAVIQLKGRYPAKGKVSNTVCKEMAYVIKGKGKLTIENDVYEVAEGDLVLIHPNEEYAWEGELEMFVPCTPAWYAVQHKSVE